MLNPLYLIVILYINLCKLINGHLSIVILLNHFNMFSFKTQDMFLQHYLKNHVIFLSKCSKCIVITSQFIMTPIKTNVIDFH